MKMLVSDFDGTLYTKNYQKNIEAVNRFVDAGNLFVINTGRNLNNLLKDLDQNLKFSYLICSDGSIVYDAYFNEICRDDIDPAVISGICDILKVNECFSNINILNGSSLNMNKVNCIYASYDASKYDMAEYALNYIQKRYPHVHGYLSERYINITNRKVNKATGIKKLIEVEKLEPVLVYTVGDDQNDIEMLNEFIGCTLTENSLDATKPVVTSVEQLIRILM